MVDVPFASLLAAAVAGDEEAFASLWRSHNPPLIRFLRGMAGADEAADLASTVWLEVVRRLDRFEGDESGFRAWLFTIARHRLIDLRRASARRPQTVQGEGQADVAGDPSFGPAGVMERNWSTEQAVALIGSLPVDQAEVLLLRVVADLDVATVAEMVGKRPGTVRVLAHRGLRRLAEQLDVSPVDGQSVTESRR